MRPSLRPSTTRFLSCTLAVACVAALGIRPAAATPPATFSASLDRFEVDGNVFGPADGTLDLVDEFDGTDFEPAWELQEGTAVEGGGVLTMHDPGALIGLVPGVTLNVSAVDNALDLTDGSGNATMTTYWTSGLPDTDRGFFFQTYKLASIAVVEAAGLTLNNSGGVYTMAYDLTIIGDVPIPSHHASVPIDPADVTGPIVMRLSFDDATNTLAGSFSLDGGATFQSPFTPVHIFNLVGTTEILVGAQSFESTTSPPPPTCDDTITDPIIVLKSNSVGFGDEQLMFRGTLHVLNALGFNAGTDGAQAQVDFLGTSATIDIDGPPGGVGSGCGPRDGWRVGPATALYRNLSNLSGPFCNLSGQGPVSLKLRTNRLGVNGSIRFVAKIRDAMIFNFPSILNATVRLGPTLPGGPTACAAVTVACSGSVGEGGARCE